MKKPGGKLSKDQLKVHKALDAQGFIVWTIDSFIDFQLLINSILEDTTQQFTFGLSKDDYFYKHKVFSFIYSLQDCELIEIDEICEEENKSKFMAYISEFMVEGYDKLEGFNLLFTPDYKAIYAKGFKSKKTVNYKGKTTI